MHQGETTATQLGWHPVEPPSYAANLKKKNIKNEKSIYKRRD